MIEYRALTTANLVIYDRPLAKTLATILPLGGYAEPAASIDQSQDRPLERCLSFAQDGWSVVCGEGAGVQHELLDVALIEAIRKEIDFAGHSMRIDYAAWARELADQIQRDDLGPDGPPFASSG